MNQAIGRRAKQNDSERERGNILLMLDTSIHGDESVVMPRRATQQMAVRNANPSGVGDSVNLITYNLGG
jgi:hypothetical protein